MNENNNQIDKDTEVENTSENTAATQETSVNNCEEDTNTEANECQLLAKQVQELTEQIEKEKNDYLFLRADFDNYRKRILKEREDLLRNAGEKVLKGLLPIVDDFERGLDATKNIENAEGVREGMEIIYNKLLKYLADNGVTAMNSTGAQFDDDFHEAIATFPAPSEDLKGKVIDTTTKGYMINDKVLRHAKVVVGE